MEESLRLNKYLSAAGVCSRRAADKLIKAGKVTVDGAVAGIGVRVSKSSVVEVNGQKVVFEERKVLLLLNKPKGIVCTAEKREKDNIVDFIGYPARIYPIGRLDKESRGLILLTNVGALHNGITRAAGGHEKEYEVTLNHAYDDDFLEHMAAGVKLPELDYLTAPAKVRRISKRKFSIILTEGKNRQIRRMCSALGYEVVDLVRTRIMDFHLDGIKEGTYREANEEEWKMIEGLM